MSRGGFGSRTEEADGEVFGIAEDVGVGGEDGSVVGVSGRTNRHIDSLGGGAFDRQVLKYSAARCQMALSSERSGTPVSWY